MKKLFNWCSNNIFFLFTLFLLAFIPLYPKVPLLDIKHTWVYIRGEDFIVFFILLYAGWATLKNRVSLKTPLTTPIFLFWIIGAVATVHGMLIIFPETANVYANVAFLSFLRRIEYMSVFFISYWSMKNKRFFLPVVITLTTTLILVSLYGIGQKYLGFPAFLTMNEEFAKGIPIQLSSLSRVSSTFAGHYDLAAYLVLIIPIMTSLFFGYRKWIVKIIFLAAAGLGLLVMFMTVSRISFFALFVSLGLVLFFQKKKIIIFLVPITVIATVVLLSFFPSLLDRFGSTVKEINVLVDAKTGGSIGHVEEIPRDYFENKVIKQQFARDIINLYSYASDSAALVIPYTYLPEKVIVLVEPDAPTGEDLPQGTGYINLPLAPITHRIGNFYYEQKTNPKTGLIDVFIINGDFLVKKAFAYDLSFTTRFQGEWPRTIDAFKRNILVGSGYGSVSLAVDNSYLRMFGEVGTLGFIAFLSVVLIVSLSIKKILPTIDSLPMRSFMFGFIAGFAGLAVNALFIDVFEASKVAFVLWILVGVILGILRLYQQFSFNIYKELFRMATSTWAMIVYIFIAALLLFSPLLRNFFVGDDFTWFRWAATCDHPFACISRYMVQSDGFFYRPGAKMYFLLMYRIFWLNQSAYHAVSFFLHIAVSIFMFLLAKKIFRSMVLSVLAAFLFLILSGFSEAIFWISATGFLFTALFSLISLLSFISWIEKKQTMYFTLTLISFILSLLFHELGIVTPLFFVLYLWFREGKIDWKKLWSDVKYRILFAPVPIYLVLRFIAGSHWLSGDYNYNVLKLPFNALGNFIGYILAALVGPMSTPVYQMFRNTLKGQLFFLMIIAPVMVAGGIFLYKKYAKTLQRIHKEDARMLSFSVCFSLIALLPFLGLGNMSPRYGYVASIGIVFLFVFFIQKLYRYLLTNGRDIAVSGVFIVISIFSLFQITQLQQMHSDWYEAGEKSRRFFTAMNSAYVEAWKTEPIELHFVNVPIRFGEAWIFPVGLPDALWFIFGNPNMRIFQWATTDQAFNAVEYGSKKQRIFMFDSSGDIQEIEKPASIK